MEEEEILEEQETPEEEDGDTEVEEETEDGDTEETPEEGDTDETPDEDNELLEQYGLSGQYKSVSDALEAIRHKESAVTNLQMENAKFRRMIGKYIDGAGGEQPEKSEEPEWTDDILLDGLNNKPIETMRKFIESQGYVRRDDIEQDLGKLKSLEQDHTKSTVAEALSQFEELEDVSKHVRSNGLTAYQGNNPTWAKMYDIARDAGLSFDIVPAQKLIPMLYRLATAEGKVQPRVTKVNRNRKLGAKTAGSGSGTPTKKGIIDFDKASVEEIDKWLKHHPEFKG